MKRVLVNIRGTNGSGKSTIPLSMYEDPKAYIIQKPYKGKKRKIATVFPSKGWIALGSYLNKTGGMDTFPNNELTQKALWYVLKKYPEYDVLMEGIIASTIRSTYIDLFQKVQDSGMAKVLVINFLPPVEVSLERVQLRNGGKPVKEDAIEAKRRTVEKCHKAFKEAGFVSVRVDTSKYSKEEMLPMFLRIVKKYKAQEG